MATIRNRYHEPVWYLARKVCEPGATIDVPDEWVEERDADGTLTAFLDPDDLFFERVDRAAVSRSEIDGVPEPSAAPDVPAPAVPQTAPEVEAAEPE